jgi:hypothetical protein
MRTRFALMVFVLIASHALAQPAPSRRQTAQAPQPPPAPVQPAAPASSTPPPPPPPPAPSGPPRREGQPINVKVELTITEEGGGATSSKKTVSAVIGDGFNGYVRANGNNPNANAAPSERFVPLNFDAYPVILANGKIRLTCTIQYLAGAAQYTAVAASPPGEPSQNQRARTDIKENIVLILESGKSLVVSQAADPVSDRQVTVEVKATILR